ncbi:ROK family transcriptional regulator [Paenactinomyces guangxiensis]|uniref:ROK family transcriptional regulator n=2 Tax=Paenactinomyces guangxiensis TaxID=1490290 RepID=A0A7W1WQG9_9BACL|nr:ROK family transcriptional regulator [Paenactinomyces guangxiensis]MBH8590698.1 ROK family transcriptional regulator [Paenactinomyces guangxiensis]
MKSLNKSTILNMVRLHGPISRAEIAKMTKLTPPTVTNIVAELLESQLIVESDLGVSTGGRKPIMLRINSSRFYVVGVYARAKKINAAIANLDGKIIHQLGSKVPPFPTMEEFLQTLKSLVGDCLKLAEADNQPVLGIGVGMHGLVDPQKGESVYAPHLKLRQIPIKEFLEQEFKISVEVENDVRAIALGESWFGQGRNLSNFICVNVGTGVGAGIMIDHQLYHGTSYSAGEIGHTTIDANGPLCSCGNIGCLEAFASGSGLVLRARQAIHSGKETTLSEMVHGDLEQLTGEIIYQAARKGDPLAIELLKETGRYLGIGLANLINTLNPSRIILHGGVSRAGSFITEPLKEVVNARSLEVPARQVSIVSSNLGKQATVIGAFTLVLKKLFTPAPS